ncbi:DNA helicase-2 / ATP-dependent DNA helicase PcrA [Lachnospiraceae bacterium XBB1006]|nr:DNA helicase-2 / ATP-dependent DNA helicase PcrA [Lachnospiraceae bacterium XBB1006]
MISTQMLNKEQQEGVFTTEGPVLILAGAGSGKTRVLTNRTAYLMEEKGVSPYHILAITFTNKAAAEMKHRIEELAGFGSDAVWVSTFHSCCVRILRRYADRLGFDTSFTIYDTDDQKSLMKDLCKRLEIDTKMYKEKMLLNVISSAKNELMDPNDFRLQAGGDYKQLKIATVYAEYQKALLKNNAMDFDDLIMKTVELLSVDNEVREAYQERFHYIMVDEYQDTNTAQFMLIKLLAGKYNNLCVVGDDDQSIYKFRGANIQNILNFESIYPNAKVIKLEQNYRSTQTILDAANAVIANNRGRKSKALWTERKGGDAISFEQFENAQEEAFFIANDIRSHVAKGEWKYQDCAVLYRTNAQSRLLEERFVAANIPYKLVGGVNFYARKEIKDLLAYLKTIDNGRDDIAVTRILNVPKRGIGLTSQSRVSEYAYRSAISFYDALVRAGEVPGIGKAAGKIKPFVDLIEECRRMLFTKGPTDVLLHVIEQTGYVKELEAEGTDEAKARIENIDELISKIVDYEQTAEEPTLGEFLEEVALVADIDSYDENTDYVVLMTLHGAKGLEFPNVYMSGMEDGIFPSYMCITSDDRDDLEEERRLCYVGITRAKNHLTMTAARTRMLRGETQYNAVSRFVKEVPSELMKGYVKKNATDEMPREDTFRKAKQAFKAKAFTSSPQPMQSYATMKTEGITLEYGEGDRVRHMKFGEGTVVKIVEGGRDYEVTVDFDTFGVKKMFALFAKLKKV